MGSFDRKFKRAEDRQELVTEEQQRLPVGKVVTAPVKGEFMALPMLAWISLRKSSDIRLLMMAVLLIRDTKVSGVLQMEMPVYPETEVNIVRCLQNLGWDGRVWPADAGWPTGTGADEENIKHFLNESKLESSIVFPPGENGNATMTVNVERAKGNFFMPPLASGETEPDPKLLARFRELCEDYKVFYPSRKDGEAIH